MPSANGEKSPVGLLVLVTTAATRISVSVTPGAVIWTFFLRSSALTEPGVVPPFGIVDPDLPLDPAFPHAAARSATVTPMTRMRTRMLPPWKTLECSRALFED